MKHFTKTLAVIMILVLAVALLFACGDSDTKSKKSDSSEAEQGGAGMVISNGTEAFTPAFQIDMNLVGSWKQEDEIDGDWIWTFNYDGTCHLEGITTGFNSDGTYNVPDAETCKVVVNMDGWDAEQEYTYAVSDTHLLLQSTYSSYYCEKQ